MDCEVGAEVENSSKIPALQPLICSGLLEVQSLGDFNASTTSEVPILEGFGYPKSGQPFSPLAIPRNPQPDLRSDWHGSGPHVFLKGCRGRVLADPLNTSL